jgi:hypothetical protein
MGTTMSEIMQQQLAWASAHGVAVDAKGYTAAIDDNLFQPLSAAARADFAAGSGDELGSADKKGKMCALHSSSALACNVFDYWRTRDLSAVSRALDLGATAKAMRFEAKFPTGLDGVPPNLDVALDAHGVTVGIECKFTEPFGSSKPALPFKSRYFPSDRKLWGEAGLPVCQQLAEGLQKGVPQFKHLNGAQLLKHVLGLSRLGAGKFRLVYLWYAWSGPESEEHASEVVAFGAALDKGIQFRALTFQEFFRGLSGSLKAEDAGYAAYLGARYFTARAV